MSDKATTTWIAIFGLILTAASVVSSVAQYKAARLQAEAAVVALTPQIEVRSQLVRSEDGPYNESVMVISSDGGPVRNYDSDQMSWIEVSRGRVGVWKQPLTGYYSVSVHTGRQRGELETRFGHENNKRFAEFYRSANTLLPEDLEVNNPRTLTRLSYQDAMGNHTEEYWLSSGGRDQLLNDREGGALWESHQKLRKDIQFAELDDLDDEVGVKSWVQFATQMTAADRDG